jgi:hypothetical protein
MVDQFDSVTHIAPAAIAGDLVGLGAEKVVEYPDLLTHGPVARKPKRHRKARLDYWRALFETIVADDGAMIDEAMESLERGYLSTEQLGSAAAHLAGEGRIVIWSTPAFEDRLFLWFAFEALVEEGVGADQIATAEPRVELVVEEGADVGFASLRTLQIDELAVGFDDLFYPEPIYVEAGANLWETFSSKSPRQFALSIPHTTKFFPQIAVFAEEYGRLFPVVSGQGAERIGLSELDAALLGRLDTDQWRKGSDILDDEILERYGFLDDIVLLGRIGAWSQCEPEKTYVEANPVPEAEVFDQHEYRLTTRGEELVEEGFEAGRRLPIFYVGDSRLYAGKKPWVRVVEGEHWWFERYEP